MATPDAREDDIFLPGGSLRLERFTSLAVQAFQEAIRLARATKWDSLRSPHIFMGLLAAADSSVRNWAERLGTDPSTLLDAARIEPTARAEDIPVEGFVALARAFAAR